MDEKNYSQHTSLGERRARLRELLKRNDVTVEDYHTVISGATEKERYHPRNFRKPEGRKQPWPHMQ